MFASAMILYGLPIAESSKPKPYKPYEKFPNPIYALSPCAEDSSSPLGDSGLDSYDERLLQHQYEEMYGVNNYVRTYKKDPDLRRTPTQHKHSPNFYDSGREHRQRQIGRKEFRWMNQKMYNSALLQRGAGDSLDLTAEQREGILQENIEREQRRRVFAEYEAAEQHRSADPRQQRIQRDRDAQIAKLGKTDPQYRKCLVWRETPIHRYSNLGFQSLKEKKQPGEVLYHSQMTFSGSEYSATYMHYWDTTHEEFLYIKYDDLIDLGIGTQMELFELDGIRKKWMIYKVLKDIYPKAMNPDGTGTSIHLQKDSYVKAFYSSNKKDATKRPFFNIKTGKDQNVKIAIEENGVPTLGLFCTKKTLSKLKK